MSRYAFYESIDAQRNVRSKCSGVASCVSHEIDTSARHAYYACDICIIMLLVVLVLLVWYIRRSSAVSKVLKQNQLTANEIFILLSDTARFGGPCRKCSTIACALEKVLTTTQTHTYTKKKNSHTNTSRARRCPRCPECDVIYARAHRKRRRRRRRQRRRPQRRAAREANTIV